MGHREEVEREREIEREGWRARESKREVEADGVMGEGEGEGGEREGEGGVRGLEGQNILGPAHPHGPHSHTVCAAAAAVPAITTTPWRPPLFPSELATAKETPVSTHSPALYGSSANVRRAPSP